MFPFLRIICWSRLFLALPVCINFVFSFT
jgi:hypothetical protein